MAKLTVQLLVWNGEKYLPHLFESLRQQTNCDWQIYIMDNGSTDNSVEVIKKELRNFNIPNFFEESKVNFGFAGGHNYIYEQTDTDYILMLNQDLYLEPDCFGEMIAFMDKNVDVASISPRLMKWNINSLEHFFSEYVDSLGLKVRKNRRVVDWMQGENWERISGEVVRRSGGQVVEVFGVSGTLPMFRRKCIEEVLYENKYIFDPNYGSYKEDVDLAFRLRAFGYRSFVLLNTCAYHNRTSNIEFSVTKNKQRQSEYIRYSSYKNHIMTIYKNEYLPNFILDFFWIMCYEVGKFVWLLLFNRSVLKGWVDIWELRKVMKKRRKEIKSKRKISWYKMRKWLNSL